MEEFKKIDGYENYEVSNLGNVKNTKTNRILKPQKNRGYYNVDLYKNGIKQTLIIHRLVGYAFIPNPENLREIDHIDRDRTNNSISNLRWVSRSNNNRNKPKKQNTSSKYMGVSFNKAKRKYRAQIRIENKQIHIGYYEKEEDAAKARDAYVKEHNLTEFCQLNFPDNS